MKAETWKFRVSRALLRVMEQFDTDVANPADVHFCYRLLLDRKPDQAGWKGWLGLLELGMTRPSLVDSFLGTSEYREKVEAKGPIRLTLDHGVLYIDPDDPLIGQNVLHSNMYEPHVTLALERLLTPSSTFVDIGANMGWFTVLAAATVTEGKVIAIEPNMGNVQLLYQSVLANAFRNVVIYPFAATEAETILELSAVRSNSTVASPGSSGGGTHLRSRCCP